MLSHVMLSHGEGAGCFNCIVYSANSKPWMLQKAEHINIHFQLQVLQPHKSVSLLWGGKKVTVHDIQSLFRNYMNNYKINKEVDFTLNVNHARHDMKKPQALESLYSIT